MSKPQLGDYGVFYETYVKLVDTYTVNQAVTTYAHPLCFFFVNLPEEKADYCYAEGKWSLKDLLQHMIDTERVMCYRMMRIARKDSTPLAGFDENLYAMNACAGNRSFVSLKEEFKALRKSTDLLLQSLTEEQLNNEGTASGHKITANALAYIIFGHLMHHKNIVEERYL